VCGGRLGVAECVHFKGRGFHTIATRKGHKSWPLLFAYYKCQDVRLTESGASSVTILSFWFAGWAAFPPETTAQEAPASPSSAPQPASEYPWNAFGGSIPNVASSQGTERPSPAGGSGERDEPDGDGTPRDLGPQNAESARKPTAGETSPAVEKPADGSVGSCLMERFRKTPAEVAKAVEVPFEPEYSTFNYWRQPVESLVDDG